MTQIGSLEYTMILDAEKFEKGIYATGKELRTMRKTMRETATPVEKLGNEFDDLAGLLAKGKIDVDLFARGVGNLKTDTDEARAAQDAHIRTLRKQADELEKAARATGVMTAKQTEAIQRLRQGADAAQKRVTQDRKLRVESQRAAIAEKHRSEVMARGSKRMAAFAMATRGTALTAAALKQELRAGAISMEVYVHELRKLKKETGQSTAAIANQIPIVGRLNAQFGGMPKGMIAATAGIAAATAALYAMQRAIRFVARHVGEAMAEIDELAKTSRKLGTTTEELAGLRLAAAEFSGMAAGQVDTALQRMTRRIAEASHGTGEAQNAIRELGLDAVALAQMSPAKAFQEISDAVKEVQNPADRLRLSFKLFDSEGAALVNTLNQGSDAIAQVQRDAEAMGMAVSSVDAAQVEAANDALGRAGEAAQSMARDLAVLLAPAIELVAKDISSFVQSFGGLRDSTDQARMGIATYIGLLKDMAKALEGVSKLARGDVIGGAKMIREASQMRGAVDAQLRAAQSIAKSRIAGAAAANQTVADAAAAATDAGDAGPGSTDRLAALNAETEALRRQAYIVGNQALSTQQVAERTAELAKQTADNKMLSEATTNEQRKQLQLAIATRDEAENKVKLAEAIRKFDDEEKAARDKELTDLKAQGEAITQSFTTPFDELVKALSDVKVLVKVGAIDKDTAAKQTDKANAEFRRAQAQSKPIRVELAPSAQRGSREEYQILAKMMSGKDQREEQQRKTAIELQRAQLLAQEESNTILREMEPATSVGT